MYTIDELICTCISRQIKDGELVAQGIATPLVAAGYLLAKLTHAPNLTFVSAIGQALCRDWAPLGVATIEQLWIKQGLKQLDFVSGVCDFLPRFGPKEFFRPGQVDPYGNFNNVYMGGSYERPRLRLPGSGGIPDVTVFEEEVYLYVPRHGRHTFVAQLDFLSGLGHHPARREGRGPRYLISDLGQFDFGEGLSSGEGENGRMRLISLHEGITLRRLQAKTGFDLILPDPIPTTSPPTAEELCLLREVIDPLGVRRLETLGGAERRQKLREILMAEKSLMRG
jgi:acyl CoA:acetate/3-ketoacid CoA transferase beta subunit